MAASTEWRVSEDPLPPGFSQVLILKKMEAKEVMEVKEVNEVEEEWRIVSERKIGRGGAYTSRVFAYEWQGKELRDRECVRVAGKGLTGGHFCVLTHDGRES